MKTIVNIPEIDTPSNLSKEFKLVTKWQRQEDTDLLFYKYKNSHLVIFDSEQINASNTHIKIQYDFPIEVLNWLIEKLDYFATPPKDGGLPAEKISLSDLISNENLGLLRGTAVGGQNTPGYVLENYSRKDRELGSICQSFSLPDPMLFEEGFLDLWKDLAQKYKNGTL